MKARVHILISGMVQGVFFRYSTRDRAQELKINGWVRNLPDGKVEAVFEGEKENIQQMIDWCHHGPDGAAVSNVDVAREGPSGEYSGFEIK